MPPAGQAGEDRPQIGAALGVKAGGRLVEEQDGGAVHQHRGDVQPPPHPAGVGPRLAPGRVGQPECVQQARPPGGGASRPRIPCSCPASARFSWPVSRLHRPECWLTGSDSDRACPAAAGQARRSRRRAPRLRPAGPASSGSAPWWSCRRRSGRAGRTRAGRYGEAQPIQRPHVALVCLPEAFGLDHVRCLALIVAPPNAVPTENIVLDTEQCLLRTLFTSSTLFGMTEPGMEGADRAAGGGQGAGRGEGAGAGQPPVPPWRSAPRAGAACRGRS